MKEGTHWGFWGKQRTLTGNKTEFLKFTQEAFTSSMYTKILKKDIEFSTVNFLTYLKQTINEKENLHKQNFL